MWKFLTSHQEQQQQQQQQHCRLEESVAEEEKWMNYGGVYVGFPTNLSDIPTIHIGSLREHDSSTLGRPLWRDGS
ncbi:uncharacterized protein [Pseudochaenichthys georgianus]|uniref:uncharacterized protein isoform X3 n=1 Tax=Pseudochaenichthys georgianus TaxID=52239 RepID=UPI0039C2E094